MNRDTDYAKIVAANVDETATIYDQVNLYSCTIGPETKIDAFVYIEENVTIGANSIIRPFVFIPTGVTIGDNVFIGPNVTFTNDRYPATERDWEMEETIIEDNVAIGAGVTVLPGVTISRGATVGAGAVVVNDVPPETTVAGNPAKNVSTSADS